MKKLTAIVVFLTMLSPVFAGGVGYINYEKVATNYSFAKTSMQEIEKRGFEIQQYLKQKELEFSKLETPLQKQKFQESVPQSAGSRFLQLQRQLRNNRTRRIQ